MAMSTTDLYVRPEDGWLLVAENPASLIIKPEDFHPWWVAVTDGSVPPSDLIGVPMGRGNDARRESFQTGEITGSVYIRVRNPIASEPTSQRARFGVIKDA